MWLSLVVLGAGVVVFVGTRWSNTGTSSDTPARVQKDVSGIPKTIPLSPAALSVARKFIVTAVARRELRSAWAISGPHVRQGMKLKEWLTGNIPVIPFESNGPARMKVDYSYANRAMVEFILLPKGGNETKAQIFIMTLIRVGPPGHKHWVVDGWLPRASTVVPNARSDS
jgi:hypothetical protein